MKEISVQSFKEVIIAESNNPSVDFINVCTPAEYKEKHIEGVRSVPLDEITAHLKDFEGKKTIYVHCRTGRRAAQAIAALKANGVTADMVNVSGGLEAWGNAGFATLSLTKRMPIMQQVLLGAGTLILLGFVFSVTLHPSFIYLSVAVGTGLAFAGITGWCGMSYVLARMPWNQ